MKTLYSYTNNIATDYMKKIYLLLAVVLYSAMCASAQKDSLRFRKNAISINVPSFPRIFSLNYERVLSQKRLVTIVHVGFYYLPFDQGSKNLTALFTGVDFLIGKKKHYLDLGAGFIFDKTIDLSSAPKIRRKITPTFIPRVGYRYQGKPKGFFVRALFTPYLIDITPKDLEDQHYNRYFNFKTPDSFWYALIPSVGFGYSF